MFKSEYGLLCNTKNKEQFHKLQEKDRISMFIKLHLSKHDRTVITKKHHIMGKEAT